MSPTDDRSRADRARRRPAAAGALAAAATGLLVVGAGSAAAADPAPTAPASTTSEVSPTAPVVTVPDPTVTAPPATTTAPSTTTTGPAPAAGGTLGDDSLGDDSGGAGRDEVRRAQRAQERKEARERRAARKDRAAARRARERDGATDAAGDATDEAEEAREADAARAADDPTSGAGLLSSDSVFSAVPSAVPGLVIERFRIPPFLLPIYQAAGVEYGVRWEILAAINEIETDYGRNLNVSSAGAQGWMQFMPATWKAYGVDADGDGRADPMSPVDAIFAAARYLRAAGAEDDLRKAIFAYNHADWYVDSVLLRARLIGRLPAALVGSLSGLTQGQLPVAGLTAAGGDDATDDEGATADADGPTWSRRPGDPRAAQLTAQPGTEVVAVQDATVVGRGRDETKGRWIRIRDVFGNVYTYAHLGSLADTHEVSTTEPERTARRAADREDRDPVPTAPATAGRQAPVTGTGTTTGFPATPGSDAATAADGAAATGGDASPSAGAASTTPAAPAPGWSGVPTATAPTPAADPAAPSAGGVFDALRLAAPEPSVERAPQALGTAAADVSSALGQARFTVGDGSSPATAADRRRRGVELRPLRKGSKVTGGTVLGTIGSASGGDAAKRASIAFGVRPAGRGAPRVDPRPILDGWRLLSASTERKGAKRTALFGTRSSATSAGQVLLLSKELLQQRVLADDALTIPEVGRRQIRSGAIDRRVLATLAYLSASGHRIRVSSLRRPGAVTVSGNVSDHSSGSAVDIAEVDGKRISAATQGPGTVTDRTIRLLLRLQGTTTPHQIISLMLPSDFGGASNVLAMADHADHIHVGFEASSGDGAALGRQLASALKPAQWDDLIARLRTIDNPEVAPDASEFAVKVRRTGRR